MSRCFPYPPPGYLVPIKGENKGNLIESIKLQKDKEKAKEERRKERKREKKDKKRKRDTLSNETVDGFGQEKKLLKEKSLKLEKQTSSLKDKYTLIHLDDESSDVTEEHDQPVCTPKPSYSSENSQNSDKKRRLTPANSIKADGSILKIRLSSFKKKEPNAINKDNVGPSTSGRTEPIGQNDFRLGQKLAKGQPCTTSTSTGIQVPGSIPMEKQPSMKFVDAGIRVPGSISREKQPSLKAVETKVSIQDVNVSKPSTSKAPEKTRKASKAELLYKSLLESWAPPAEEGYDDDQDWLFPKKSQNATKSEMSNNVPCSLDSNLWPRAQFLPSVNVYALPYTVPF